MTTEDNKDNSKDHNKEDNAALVASFLDELWNQKNLDVIAKATAADYVLRMPQGELPGQQALRDVAANYFKSFSDIEVKIGRQISQDDQVVTQIVWNIRLDLMDQSSNQEIHREIPARGVSIDRLEDGLIVESRNTIDEPYWIYNIQVLSRDPRFVKVLPASRGCPPGCPDGQTCRGHQCV
ncbi:MAG TPA: ester cyclase [Ktedonobacteraceae bacterium]|nr:ester cyclase [Ktedonobacteraceae bacterium]